MIAHLDLWIGLNVFIVVMLLIDLLVFNRKAHAISIKEAGLWSIFWIALAIVFGWSLKYFYPADQIVKYFTAYVVEKSLSVDNLFVFIVIFAYYAVPLKLQHKVLFAGIVGTMLLRAVFIAGGITILNTFQWVIYVFGAFLVYTGIKLVTDHDKKVDPEKNPVIVFLRKFLPVTPKFQGDHFFVKLKNKLHATPMFIVMIVIVVTDVIFAVDSIPAVLAITNDPFIAYSSNMFAVMGLRALFFVVEGMIQLFHYINYGLAVILSFIGVKLLVSHYYHLPISWTLGFIGGVLAISILASIIWPKKSKH
jgi:tellurite resistance protein TerC